MTDFNALYLYNIAIEEAYRKCYNLNYERMIYLLEGISMNDPQWIYQGQPVSVSFVRYKNERGKRLLFDFIARS